MRSGMLRRHFGLCAALCLSALTLNACASGNTKNLSASAEPIDADPLEPMNRGIYKFNYAVDTAVLRPVTVAYRYAVPETGREMVSHFLENIYSPVVLVNSVAQGDPQNSFATFWRFMINSTFGIGGLFDVASEAGLKNRQTDFGQTMSMADIGTGPYIVLPIIGPSNARDAIGRLADALINPFNYISNAASAGMWTATAIDARSNNMTLIDDVYRTSLDPYSTFRSGFTQKRASDNRRAKAARDKAVKQVLGTSQATKQ